MKIIDWTNLIENNIKQYDLCEFIKVFVEDNNYFNDIFEAESYYFEHI